LGTLVVLFGIGWNATARAGDGEDGADATKDETQKTEATAEGRFVLGGHEGAVLRVTRGPDGKWHVSSSNDTTRAPVVVVQQESEAEASPPQQQRARASRRHSPLFTMLRWLVKKQTGKDLTADGIEQWFDGDEVPLQDLRDMFLEDGWNAAALKRWWRGAAAPRARSMHPRRELRRTRGMQGPRMEGWTGVGHAGGGPGIGVETHMDGPRVLILTNDGSGWKVQEAPRPRAARSAVRPHDLRGLIEALMGGRGGATEMDADVRKLLEGLGALLGERADVDGGDADEARAAVEALGRLVPGLKEATGECDGDCESCPKKEQEANAPPEESGQR
jgi:hypothetical protein